MRRKRYKGKNFCIMRFERVTGRGGGDVYMLHERKMKGNKNQPYPIDEHASGVETGCISRGLLVPN